MVTFTLLVQLPRAHLRQVHEGFHGGTLQVLPSWPLCNLSLVLQSPAPGRPNCKNLCVSFGCLISLSTSTCPVLISITGEDILVLAGRCGHYCIWNGNRQAECKACDPLWLAPGRY